MGLGLRWIVSFCMLIVPIAITLGVLFPLQAQHRNSGAKGSVLGDGGGSMTDPGSPGGSAPSKPKNNNVELQTSCDQFAGMGIDRFWAKGQTQYTFNPNQWGLDSGAKSGMCMNVLFNNNGTYYNGTTAQSDLAPPFQMTWQYDPAPAGKNNVHAFPNVKLETDPIEFNTVSKLYVDFEWKYVMGNDNTTASETAALVTSNTVNANVAIDMFADNDKTISANNTNAQYEIMVWFAEIGPAAHAIGQDTTPIVTSKTLTDQISGAQTTFDLYADKHPTTSQFVMTWKARTITEKFHGDIFPLIDFLISSGNASYPTKTAYLGSFGMGSEAYDSPSNVTFYCPDFAVLVT